MDIDIILISYRFSNVLRCESLVPVVIIVIVIIIIVVAVAMSCQIQRIRADIDPSQFR